MNADMRTRTKIRIVPLCVLLCCLAAAGSCAYFNTLYNARRIYRDTEEKREAGRGGEREMRENYEEVVAKCAQVVRDYPNSRWVDDALFLMGKALVRQGEIDKGVRKFVELMTNFPESDYVPKSIYWLGLAHYEKGDYNQTLVYTDRFLKEYPTSDIRSKVLFLAGDTHRELEQEEEALSYYARVAEESSDGETTDKATLKTAELFFSLEKWEKAAAAYQRVLRKGIPWERRYEISLALGECYSRLGECQEALEVYDSLLEQIVSAKEKPDVVLGRGRSYVCMDSLETALSIFKGVTGEFPRSAYAAEAYYRIGVIYQERLDSLSGAQEAFGKVAGEYANSPFAEEAIQKSSSIKRLLELEKGSGGDAGSAERLAEKRFLAAEIQLTRLGEVDLAIANYSAVVDSFPRTNYAPQSAYAIAWIYENEKSDRDRAVEMYRRVVTRYPRSPQAHGAIERIGTLGALDLKEQMQAVIDSAMVDTTGVDQHDETEATGEGRIDTLTVPSPADTGAAPPVERPSVGTAIDSTRVPAAEETATVPAPAAPSDSTATDSTNVPPADTAGARSD